MLPPYLNQPLDINPQPKYRLVIVTDLLERGDFALSGDDWETASSCYKAAYFCGGGRDSHIKKKIEFVEDIAILYASIESAAAMVESARHNLPVLQIMINDLERMFIKLKAHERETINEGWIPYLKLKLIASLERAYEYTEYP